ncbi:hypothetical protein V1225_05875 [Emergencia sp. JLR.KK010]|uniref:hypothetical protein n=1 Tax=Emergencia sp. JLR.KK010 TaxID=3114296 RepID=UPI0030D29C71
MNKCMASEGGICRNAYALGLKCDGYSSECKLRPHYSNVEKATMAVIESIRKSFGLKGE